MPATTTEERVGAHDVILAVHSEQIGALMKANESVVGSMNKLIWTVITGSLSVTIALLGAIITLLAS